MAISTRNQGAHLDGVHHRPRATASQLRWFAHDAQAAAGVALLTVTGGNRTRAADLVYNLTPMVRSRGLAYFRFLSVDTPVEEAPALLKAAPIVAPIGIGAADLHASAQPRAGREAPREGKDLPAPIPSRLSKAGAR